MATKRSETEQSIEQIAGIIYDNLTYNDDPFTRQDADNINDSEGWTFDVTYDTSTYSGGRWTHVEGYTLTSDQLDDAWALAQHWAGEDYLSLHELHAGRGRVP